MYNYRWDKETGGYLLDTKITGVVKEVRPVYKEELRLLGFDTQCGWHIPDTDAPLMWAEGRRYIYFGECVAEATGGGLYVLPTIKSSVRDLVIKSIDFKQMADKNRTLMTGVEQKTLKFIYNTYKTYIDAIDIVYVAFSGGKDSMVMLDLVQRALPHNGFKVIFGDTTMELAATYNIVEVAKKRWDDLSWHTAIAPFDAKESWEKFGPPARNLRWCCSVHKTVPSILKIKELLAEERNCSIDEIKNFKTLAFLGIRAEESDARSTYGLISDGNKHTVQINCNPILEWNTSELFLYYFDHWLPMNDAYRQGSHRVGCLLCPMSATWYECIVNHVYPNEVLPYTEIVRSAIRKDYEDECEWEKYLSEGGWKQRASGKSLRHPSDKILEMERNNEIQFVIRNGNYPWDKWIKTIGMPVPIDKDKYQISYKDVTATLFVKAKTNIVTIILEKPHKTLSSIRFVYLFKNALYKAAYCSNCRSCMVECPAGALSITKNNISIGNCSHCEKCLEVGLRGCLICKSKMSTGDGNMSFKNIDRYKNFGLRQKWIELYFENIEDFWKNERMGSHMFLSFRVWGKEAGIMERNNSPLPIVEKLYTLGSESPLVWAYMFNNIAYSSAIFNWFINNCDFNTAYQSSDLLIMLGDKYSETTRKNALTALKDTLKSSPIGLFLGQGDLELKGKVVKSITRIGWDAPEPLAILYSLYKFSEMSDGLYSFTVSDLFDYKESDRGGISPIALYNIDWNTCKQIVEGLAREYRGFIGANFNKGILEDIYLNHEKSSLDVVKLF